MSKQLKDLMTYLFQVLQILAVALSIVTLILAWASVMKLWGLI